VRASFPRWKLGFDKCSLTIYTGLAEQQIHPFSDFRFRTMLLFLLSFLIGSGRVLEVSLPSTSPFFERNLIGSKTAHASLRSN
jgi:hypothetical protein